MTELDKELIDLGVTSMRLAEDNMRLTQENARLTEQIANDALHGRTTLTNTDAVFGGTVMLKDNDPTCALREENQRLKNELDKTEESMRKLIEATVKVVELSQFQGEQIKQLKAENDKLKGDDMADDYLKAESEAADASHWGQVAVFIDLVRQMRAAQAEYFRTRDKDVMRKSIALEKEVDSEIKGNDNVAWVLQYLK